MITDMYTLLTKFLKGFFLWEKQILIFFLYSGYKKYIYMPESVYQYIHVLWFIHFTSKNFLITKNKNLTNPFFFFKLPFTHMLNILNINFVSFMGTGHVPLNHRTYCSFCMFMCVYVCVFVCMSVVGYPWKLWNPI